MGFITMMTLNDLLVHFSIAKEFAVMQIPHCCQLDYRVVFFFFSSFLWQDRSLTLSIITLTHLISCCLFSRCGAVGAKE